MRVSLLILCLNVGIIIESVSGKELPNIVVFLLEGVSINDANGPGLSKTRHSILGDGNGVKFDHMLTTTPLCCPSRTSIYSGQYMHNHGTMNNTVKGNCQTGQAYDKWVKSHSYAYNLQQRANYYTCHVGDYLLPAKKRCDKEEIREKFKPEPGWDNWRTTAGTHVYYNYGINVNGQVECHGDDYNKDYHSDVMCSHAIQCIQDYVNSGAQAQGRPFHLTFSTAAAHTYYLELAPEYKNVFPDLGCPRTPDFLYEEDEDEAKHWIVSGQERGFNETQVRLLDDVCRIKQRVLKSVDVAIELIMAELEKHNMSRNTYTALSADHGYYVGQFGMAYGKMMPYDSSVKVPFWVSGPGIDGRIRKNVPVAAANIDMAPTFLAMGGLAADPSMDGVSLLDHMKYPLTKRSERDHVLIEYRGLDGYEYRFDGPPCPGYDGNVSLCFGNLNCICQDARNNTYNCLRSINPAADTNIEYCEFQDDVGFIEFYDLNQDPYQLHNTAKSQSGRDFEKYKSIIKRLKACRGSGCHLK